MKKSTAILRYLFFIHILALVIFSLFRVMLYLSNIKHTEGVENKTELFIHSMLNGLRFDNSISLYILLLPVAILSLLSLLNIISKLSLRIFRVYFILLYALAFAVSAADIPYFQYFFSHMGYSALNWLQFGGTTVGMMFQEKQYLLYILSFIILVIIFYKALCLFERKLISTETTKLNSRDLLIYIPVTLLIWGISILGIRGSVKSLPLRVGHAYFTNNSFFNQLGISPSFYLIKSMSGKNKGKNKLTEVIDTESAIQYVQSILNIPTNLESVNFLDRFVENKKDEKYKNANVVVILMESMSHYFLSKQHNGENITPYLHNLIGKSYYFENFFSSGIHTNNGIVSTLYGFPPLFDRTMMGPEANFHTGIPMNLENAGYNTLFFITGSPQYDNMSFFLYENGFNKLYAESDYPKEKRVNNFGISDEYLFEYGLKTLNEQKNKTPFLATFLTVSNHPPLVVPDKFKNKGADSQEDIVFFADYCIQNFMEQASKESWYNNTVFVLVGDHGKIMGQEHYEMSINYNHVPLIIYSPLFDDTPKKISTFGTQMDIFPTVMGILGQSYINNSLGIDLLKENRKYAYFVSDNKLGTIDTDFFFIYDPNSKEEKLYKYRDANLKNFSDELRSVSDSMKNYSISMMIATEVFIQNNKSDRKNQITPHITPNH